MFPGTFIGPGTMSHDAVESRSFCPWLLLAAGGPGSTATILVSVSGSRTALNPAAFPSPRLSASVWVMGRVNPLSTMLGVITAKLDWLLAWDDAWDGTMCGGWFGCQRGLPPVACPGSLTLDPGPFMPGPIVPPAVILLLPWDPVLDGTEL